MSLIETMMTLAVIGLLIGATARGAAAYRDRLAVERAHGTVLEAYRRAQSAARAWARPAELIVSQDSISIRSIGLTDTVELFRRPGPGQDGVAIVPASHRALFGASGLPTGAANVTHVLARGATNRTVVVSRLGRVVVQ